MFLRISYSLMLLFLVCICFVVNTKFAHKLSQILFTLLIFLPRYVPNFSVTVSPEFSDSGWFQIPCNGSQTYAEDRLGALLCAQLENMVVLKRMFIPNRFPYSPFRQTTSPEVTFASADLSLKSRWEDALIWPTDNRSSMDDLMSSTEISFVWVKLSS